MTETRIPWQERWLRWSLTGACRLFSDVAPEDQAQLDERLRGAYGPVGLLTCTAQLEKEEGGWILGIYFGGTYRRAKLDSVTEVPGTIATEVGLVCIEGSFLWRNGTCVCLIGPDASNVRAKLESTGWHNAGEVALWRAEDALLLIDGRRFETIHLVRCRRAATRIATASRAHAEEAADWLRPVTTGDAASLLERVTATRLVFGRAAEAVAVIEEVTGEPAETLSPLPEPECLWLAVGDTCAQIAMVGLSAEEAALVRYYVGGLACEPAPAPSFMALARIGSEARRTWSSGPNHLESESGSDIGLLATRVDHFAQRALLDTDRSHVVFLGSTVQKGDAVIWLLGLRGSGKTSLALELVFAHGYGVLTDDFVPWHPADQAIVPYAKCARLGPGAFADFSERAHLGVQKPPTDVSPALWLLDPGVELERPEPTSGRRGILVRCLLDPTIEAPFLVERRSEERARFDLHQDARPPEGEGVLDSAVDVILERFEAWTLRYRDRVAAAAELAKLAAADSD